MVLRRLARLPAPASQTAQAIAVLGDGASLPHVAALAGTSEPEAATAVAAMVRAEVARSDYPLGFVHPLVADAVYRDLSAGERELRHERAARVLRDAGAPGEKVAAHLLRRRTAGTPGSSRCFAARPSARSSAGRPTSPSPISSVPWPSRRSRHHARVLHELGRVQVMSDGQAGVANLREAYAGLSDPARRIDVAQLITRALVFAGEAGEPTAFAQQVLAEMPEDLLDGRQGLEALGRVGGYMHGVPPKVWRTETTVTGSGPGARLLAAELAWEAVIDGSDRAEAVRYAHLALDDDQLLLADISLLWVVAVIALQYADEDTAAYWERGLAYSYRRGSMWGVLANELWRGHLHLLRGELPDAVEAFVISTEQQNRWGNRMLGAIYGETMNVDALLDMGDVVGARAPPRQHPRSRARRRRRTPLRLLRDPGPHRRGKVRRRARRV